MSCGFDSFRALTSKALHTQLNICHRDIRPANLIRYKDEGHIIDFAFAIDLPSEPQKYQGVVRHASPRVLKSLMTGSMHLSSFSDDCQSLVRSLITLTNPFLELPDKDDIARLAVFWEDVVKTGAWANLEDAAIRADYEAMLQIVNWLL